VEKVMRAAGLTVGGFYAHFTSKEALFTETLRTFLQQRRERWLGGLEELRGREWLSLFVRRYLNPQMRDSLTSGCMMPSLWSDLTRAPADTQAVVVEELELLLREVQPHLRDEPGVTARQRALATVAMCFGAMTLARATSSQPFSDELLQAARALLLEGERSPSRDDPTSS
jgi:TetR/AcrR family transcriptional repressor of nem operon